MTKESKPSVRSIIIEALGALGMQGMRAPDLYAHIASIRPDVLAPDAGLAKALKEGYAFKLGSMHEARFFATQADLEAGRGLWEAWVAHRRKTLTDTRKAKAKARDDAKAARRPPRPERVAKPAPKSVMVRAPWTVDTPAIILETTKITIAPRPPEPCRTNTYARSG